MVWHRFRDKHSWQQPVSHKPDSEDLPGDYDFHTFCLEIKDVIWAWVCAGGVVLVLLFVL